MFTYLYNNKIYRFFKSGLLLDFFFKKFIFKILWILYYIFNIFFGEKYFIEHNFLKLLLYLDFIKNSFNFISKYFTFYFIGILMIVSLVTVYLSI